MTLAEGYDRESSELEGWDVSWALLGGPRGWEEGRMVGWWCAMRCRSPSLGEMDHFWDGAGVQSDGSGGRSFRGWMMGAEP